MRQQLLTIGRLSWLGLCLTAGLGGGLLFGFNAAGVLGAIARGIGGAFVGLLIGVSFVNVLLTLLELAS